MIFEVTHVDPRILLVMVWVDQMDASTAPPLKAAIPDDDERLTAVIVAMSRVRFVDSAGLSSLLSLQRRLYAQDIQLCVCGLTRTVQALFEIMQVQRLIEVYPNRQAALTHFGIKTTP